MSAVAAGSGWTGTVFADLSGLADNNRMSFRKLVKLAQIIAADQPFLLTVKGTLSRGLTITGVKARTQSVTHTINPNGAVKFPEFLAGKTGTTGVAGAGGVVIWTNPDGSRHVTGVLGSTPGPASPTCGPSWTTSLSPAADVASSSAVRHLSR
jgi:D-alanyl-D-alanine carboxypeptidase